MMTYRKVLEDRNALAWFILAYALTYIVIRCGKTIRAFTTIFGFLMVVNALSHFSGSIYFNKIFPGTWSAPFLLAAALFVIFQGLKGDWQVKNYYEMTGGATRN
ncbi:MAG: hypothetical protein ACE5I1_15760 [bacterium]